MHTIINYKTKKINLNIKEKDIFIWIKRSLYNNLNIIIKVNYRIMKREQNQKELYLIEMMLLNNFKKEEVF